MFLQPKTNLKLTRVLLFVLLATVFVVADLVSAAPGVVSFYVRPVNTTTSQLVAKNVAQTTGSFPAIAWDVYLNFDHSLGRLASVTPGADWAAMDCGFAVNVSDAKPHFPTPNDVIINGFCTTRIPEGISKSEVVLATLTWADCKRGFLVDLRTGTREFGGPVTDMFDVQNDPYQLTDADLFDGGACGNTTENLQSTSPNSISSESSDVSPNSLLPVVVGVLMVCLAGVVVLLRRRVL